MYRANKDNYNIKIKNDNGHWLSVDVGGDDRRGKSLREGRRRRRHCHSPFPPFPSSATVNIGARTHATPFISSQSVQWLLRCCDQWVVVFINGDDLKKLLYGLNNVVSSQGELVLISPGE